MSTQSLLAPLFLIAATACKSDAPEDTTTGILQDHSTFSVAGEQLTIDVLTTFEPDSSAFDETQLYPVVEYWMTIDDPSIASFDGQGRVGWERTLSATGDILEEQLTLAYDCHKTGETPVTLTRRATWFGPDLEDTQAADLPWTDTEDLGEPVMATLSCKTTQGDYLVLWDLELAVVRVDEDGAITTLAVKEWLSDLDVYPYVTSVITMDGQVFMTGQDDWDGSPMLLSTTDGSSFENLARDQEVDTWLGAAAYGDGALLAGGYDGGWTWSAGTWTRWAETPMSPGYPLTWADDRFVSLDGSWTEDKGQTWTSSAAPPELGHPSYSCITAGDGRVVIGDSGGTGWFSDDGGETWQQATLDEHAGWAFSRCYNGTYGEGRFVMAMDGTGGSAAILTSTDGSHWEAASVPDGVANITHVVHVPSEGFMAAGETLLRSADGLTWTEVPHDLPFVAQWIAPLGG